jgi:hypothetical protein
MSHSIVSQPILIPYETTRDCIVQDGKRFCESTETNPADIGYGILGIVVFCVWAFGGLLSNWRGHTLAAYYIVPPVLLGIALVLL